MGDADFDKVPIAEANLPQRTAVTLRTLVRDCAGPYGVLILALAVCVTIAFVADGLAGELGRRRKAIDPQTLNAATGYPGGRIDPWPPPGPRPYWGQALGATHYNWGYFGAQHNQAQLIRHSGFYEDYTQFGYASGY